MADSSDSGGSAAIADMKACPFCGENIKKVAVRCKHCQADLTKAPPEADFTRGVASLTPEEFEVRFLEFAYQTTATINVPAVAHALKLPTNIVSERLEDMAARDVLVREIDDGGNVYFMIPGRIQRPAHPPLATTQGAGALAIGGPAEGSAVAAMVLNVIIPGSGSLVAGRISTGVAQMLLWVIGFPLCFVLVGFPMVLAAWVWSLVTGIHILEESRRRQQSLS